MGLWFFDGSQIRFSTNVAPKGKQLKSNIRCNTFIYSKMASSLSNRNSPPPVTIESKLIENTLNPCSKKWQIERHNVENHLINDFQRIHFIWQTCECAMANVKYLPNFGVRLGTT